MASDYNVNSAVQLNSDPGASFALNRQPVRVKSYFGAQQNSTTGSVRMWDNPQWGGPTNMDLGDKPEVTPPQSYGSN